jgi:hypothetical protein
MHVRVQISGSAEGDSAHTLTPRASKVASELKAWLSCTHQGAGAITAEHLTPISTNAPSGSISVAPTARAFYSIGY